MDRLDKNLKAMLITAALAPVLAVLVSPVAYGQTPDEETPAEESVCDAAGLRWSTPGLYGLCVAYCEAHDAELISPAGDPAELNTPNREILERYNEKKQPGDPDMPCVQAGPCPCFTAAQLNALRAPTAEEADNNAPNACRILTGINLVFIECIIHGQVDPTCYWQAGQWSDSCFRLNIAANQVSIHLPTTPEQAESCRAIIAARAELDATPEVWSCFLPSP
jgi:hypothetical protein